MKNKDPNVNIAANFSQATYLNIILFKMYILHYIIYFTLGHSCESDLYAGTHMDCVLLLMTFPVAPCCAKLCEVEALSPCSVLHFWELRLLAA